MCNKTVTLTYAIEHYITFLAHRDASDQVVFSASCFLIRCTQVGNAHGHRDNRSAVCKYANFTNVSRMLCSEVLVWIDIFYTALSDSTMGNGSFPGVKSGRRVTLTPHPLLVPWSRKRRAVKLNNCPTKCDLFSLLHFCRQIYMYAKTILLISIVLFPKYFIITKSDIHTVVLTDFVYCI